MMGKDYTIADIACWAGSAISIGFYEAAEFVDYTNQQCVGWLERGLARPAVQRGLKIPAKD